MHGPLHGGLGLGPTVAGWSPQRNLPALGDRGRWEPPGPRTVSVALGQPCIAGLPRVSRVGGFNRLLNLNRSLLALRAGTCQRGCAGRFPTGMLDGWTWATLLLEKRGEEGRGRQALTHTRHEGSVTGEQLLRDTARSPWESHCEEQDWDRERKK